MNDNTVGVITLKTSGLKRNGDAVIFKRHPQNVHTRLTMKMLRDFCLYCTTEFEFF